MVITRLGRRIPNSTSFHQTHSSRGTFTKRNQAIYNSKTKSHASKSFLQRWSEVIFLTTPGLGPFQRERESWVTPQKKQRVRSCEGGASNAGEAVQAPEEMITAAHCLSARCKNGSAVVHFQSPTQTPQPSKRREDGATKRGAVSVIIVVFLTTIITVRNGGRR